MSEAAAKKRILVLFAHPALQKSRVNRHLARAVADQEGVTFHDLYECYPDFDIDVRREQDLLLTHDVFVFQHPFYWYSTPAILKEWQDLVLEHGWAYGAGGKALHGKTLLSRAIDRRRQREAYCAEGMTTPTPCASSSYADRADRRAVRDATYLPPFVVHGTHTPEPRSGSSTRRRGLPGVAGGAARRHLDLEAASRDARVNSDLDVLDPEPRGTDGRRRASSWRRSSTSRRRSIWCRSPSGSASARCSAT